MPRIAALAAASLLAVPIAPVAVLTPADAKPAPRPTLTAKVSPVTERAANVVIGLRLSSRAKGTVKVAWRTQDGTAKAGADYRRGAGTVAIKKGRKAASITVRLLDDRLDETTESFRVLLSSRGARVPAKAVAVRVIDNDPAPTGPTGPAEPTEPTQPTQPKELTGTITVTQMSPFPVGSTTLTMTPHLVPTSTPGEWRDNGTGTWVLSGSLTAINPVCIGMPSTTTISGAGTFLRTGTTPVTGQATLLLDDFDATGATGTPSLTWDARGASSTPTWSPDPMSPATCIGGAPIVSDYSFAVAAPGAAGTYTGETGPGRGVSFSFLTPTMASVSGTLTPVS